MGFKGRRHESKNLKAQAKLDNVFKINKIGIRFIRNFIFLKY